MSAKRILDLSFHSVLFLLLAATLLAVTVASVWTFTPSTISKIDRKIVRSYVNRYESKLRKAGRLATEGSTNDGILVLTDLLHELKETRKGDRLDAIKRRALEQLVQAYVETSNIEQALEWVNTWLAFDDRDLVAQVRRATLLALIPGRRAEGIDLMAGLYARTPISAAVVDGYTTSLLEQGENSEALFTWYRFSQLAQTRLKKMPWQIFWDTGRGFNQKQSMRINPIWKDDDYVEIMSTIPKGSIRRLRIDSPPAQSLHIKDGMVDFDDGLNECDFPLKHVEVHHNDIRSTAQGNFVTAGKDPYLYFKVPEEIGSNGPVKVEVRAQVFMAPPEALNAVLFRPKEKNGINHALEITEQAEAADYFAQRSYLPVPNSISELRAHIESLLDSGKNAEAALVGYRFSQMVDLRLRGMAWEVYWDTGEGFSASRSERLEPIWQASGTAMMLTLTLPPGKLKQFRIDTPSGIDLRLAESEISFHDGMKESSLQMKNTHLRYNQVAALGDGVLLASGNDPYFYFKVPEDIGSQGEVNIVYRAKVSTEIPERLNTLLSRSEIRKQIVAQLRELNRNEAADYIASLP